MSALFFTPCARTFWHRHDGGQLIIVTSGEGLVVERGGEAVRVRAGDAVWSPPGVEHWHGASGSAPVSYYAVTYGDSEFLEEVSDGDFSAADSSGR